MVPRRSRRGITRGETSFRAALGASAREHGRTLSDGELDALEVHYRLLLRWNRRINLTGLRGEAAILRRHFLEPIAAADLLGDEGTLVDLGSGNGFPAVPLKILHPRLCLVMVESSEKRSAFLWAVIRETGLTGARVETRRVRAAADLSDLLPCRHLTSRGVRAPDLLRDRGGAPAVLEPGGRALLFVAEKDAAALRGRPLPGTTVTGTRRLPGAGSIVAILEPGD
ncbi:MAG: 16S rRNA (guanine(527)-N(7))-methyltransferase RsmG [Acidobacteriota bacterium]